MFGSVAPVSAQFEMPDPKQMSGIPRPVTDLPNGSLSVRLIKGDLSNNLTGHPVQLHIGDKVQTVNTDAEGRAQFDHLPQGATVKAEADVEGEHLESQEFPAPAQGGIRLMLVATDKEKERQKEEEAKAPAITGQVVIGGESRIVIEPGEESVSVYYLLEIENTARVRVNPPAPFVFDMPKEMTGTAVLQGSSPLATNSGNHVTIMGPFPPGKTIVQVGGGLPVMSDTVEFTQTFPTTFSQLVFIAKKDGNLKVASPQIERQQDTVVEGGTAVIIGAGGLINAGQPISFTLSGLPYHSSAPRLVALWLAFGIAVVGIVAAFLSSAPKGRTDEHKRLTARREKLLQDLVRLEHDHRRSRIDVSRYTTRREELLRALEQVYGALDSDDIGPDPADRTGLAA
jgi:hypothetical protein